VHPSISRTLRPTLALGALEAVSAVGAGPASANPGFATSVFTAHPGFATSLFTSTNSPATTGNSVEAFLRLPDGSLVPNGTYPTDGLGSGTGAPGSSDAPTGLSNAQCRRLRLGPDLRFNVSPRGTMALSGTVGSGGADPTSVAVDRDLVEVLNAGLLNVAGFTGPGPGWSRSPALRNPLAPAPPVRST